MGEVDILVMDDDPTMIEGLEETLESEGYTVTALMSPAELPRELKKKRFKIALVDLIMPEKNGIEVVKEISRQSPETKVIIITGFATVESAVDAMKAGASDYITKPFRIDEIQGVVKKTLEEIRFEEELTPTLGATEPDKVIKAVSNPIRRAVVEFLDIRGRMRFTDILSALDIDDPTKLSFHLRELKGSGLLGQGSEKKYFLTGSGKKIASLLKEL